MVGHGGQVEEFGTEDVGVGAICFVNPLEVEFATERGA